MDQSDYIGIEHWTKARITFAGTGATVDAEVDTRSAYEIGVIITSASGEDTLGHAVPILIPWSAIGMISEIKEDQAPI